VSSPISSPAYNFMLCWFYISLKCAKNQSSCLIQLKLNLFLLLYVYFSVLRKADLAASMLELVQGELRVSLSMVG